MRKYRKYSLEFKKAVIAEIDSGNMSKNKAAREHDISHSLIERWKKQIYEGTIKEHATPREKQLERELERYKNKVGELTLQVDLLKKLNENSLFMKKLNGSVITQKDLDQSDGGAR